VAALPSSALRRFDARLNPRRIGRVVVGRGRDAVDVAMLTSYGQVELVAFEVEAEQVEDREVSDAIRVVDAGV